MRIDEVLSSILLLQKNKIKYNSHALRHSSFKMWYLFQ